MTNLFTGCLDTCLQKTHGSTDLDKGWKGKSRKATSVLTSTWHNRRAEENQTAYHQQRGSPRYGWRLAAGTLGTRAASASGRQRTGVWCSVLAVRHAPGKEWIRAFGQFPTSKRCTPCFHPHLYPHIALSCQLVLQHQQTHCLLWRLSHSSYTGRDFKCSRAPCLQARKCSSVHNME